MHNRGRVEENTRELIFKARGIICLRCGSDMEKILQEKEGIINSSVDYAGETVTVRYNPGSWTEKRSSFLSGNWDIRSKLSMKNKGLNKKTTGLVLWYL